MAIVVPRNVLTRQQEELIVSMLTIKPIQKIIPNLKMYQQEKESFPFFQTDKQSVRVPYAFGNVLLKDHPHDCRDYRRIKVRFNGKLRPRQSKKVIKLNQLFADHRTATFCGHTGFGKTLLGNYYISTFGLLTVVLVPGTQLMSQWPQAIRDTLDQVRVGIVGENYSLDGWSDGTTFQSFDQGYENHPDVLICMPDRWNKIPEEIRHKIGFMIIDEAHMFCTPTRCIPLLQFEPKYILALTASPRRSDGTMGVIHSMCGLHQVQARYQNPVCVWKFCLDLQFPTVKNMRGQTNWSGTVKKIVEDETFNSTIADLAVYLITEMKRKPIFMCDRKYHVEDLSRRFKQHGITSDFLMENKNTYEDSQTLLAIMKKAGTGFDEQYACPDFGGIRIDTVVYCTSFKEINGLIQYGGRAFRAQNPLIIHLVVQNGIIENHWRAAQKYYRSGEYLKNVTIETVRSNDIWEEEEIEK